MATKEGGRAAAEATTNVPAAAVQPPHSPTVMPRVVFRMPRDDQKLCDVYDNATIDFVARWLAAEHRADGVTVESLWYLFDTPPPRYVYTPLPSSATVADDRDGAEAEARHPLARAGLRSHMHVLVPAIVPWYVIARLSYTAPARNNNAASPAPGDPVNHTTVCHCMLALMLRSVNATGGFTPLSLGGRADAVTYGHADALQQGVVFHADYAMAVMDLHEQQEEQAAVAAAKGEQLPARIFHVDWECSDGATPLWHALNTFHERHWMMRGDAATHHAVLCRLVRLMSPRAINLRPAVTVVGEEPQPSPLQLAVSLSTTNMWFATDTNAARVAALGQAIVYATLQRVMPGEDGSDGGVAAGTYANAAAAWAGEGHVKMVYTQLMPALQPDHKTPTPNRHQEDVVGFRHFKSGGGPFGSVLNTLRGVLERAASLSAIIAAPPPVCASAAAALPKMSTPLVGGEMYDVDGLRYLIAEVEALRGAHRSAAVNALCSALVPTTLPVRALCELICAHLY